MHVPDRLSEDGSREQRLIRPPSEHVNTPQLSRVKWQKRPRSRLPSSSSWLGEVEVALPRAPVSGHGHRAAVSVAEGGLTPPAQAFSGAASEIQPECSTTVPQQAPPKVPLALGENLALQICRHSLRKRLTVIHGPGLPYEEHWPWEQQWAPGLRPAGPGRAPATAPGAPSTLRPAGDHPLSAAPLLMLFWALCPLSVPLSAHLPAATPGRGEKVCLGAEPAAEGQRTAPCFSFT